MAHKLAPSPNTARTPASPNTARTPAFTENFPAVAGQVSAIGSINAPFIFTDWIGSHGIRGGVVNITLEAVRHMLINEKTAADRVVVAHLRMPYASLAALKEAVAQIELIAAGTPTGMKQ